MTGIVRIALERPYTFVVAAMLVLLFGVMSAIRTPKDIFPDIGIPVIAVVWSYSGLPPDDMSGRIVYIFERGLTTTVNDIEHIELQSVPGFGIVKIYFQPRVNIAAAQAQVTSISQTQLKQLPPGVTPPLLVIFNASSVPILQLALSSPTASQTELNDLASNFVRPPLTNVAGAALPGPYGGVPRQVQIDLDQRALHSYGLGAQDVVNALSVQNLITPAGTEKIGANEYTINLNGSPQKVADFNDLPIKAVNGGMVYVRDVAFAHDGSPPQTNVVQLDGRKGVLMTVLKAGSASTLDIIAGIKELLPRIQETLPPGVELKIVNDQSGFVKASVFSVIREGVIAAGLTGLMILLFLGSWRSTLIISISIPLSILAALPVLAALGETINVMTLGGFALAVGMLVDEATVTIENINWHLEHGKEIKTAILDGAAQIVVAATLSLLCICIAFVPMFGLGGVAGYLFRPLAEAVVFAMIASYLWSRTLVPTMALYLLRNQVHHGVLSDEHGAARKGNALQRFQQGFERAFEQFRTAYVGLLGLALRHRRVGVTMFLVMPLLSFGLMPFLGKNFFPDIEGNALRLHVRAHPGTRIEEVTRLVNEVEAEIRTVIPPDEILSTVDNIGLPLSGTNMAYSNSGTIGVIDADLLISLSNEPSMPTAEYVKSLREILPRKFPGMTFAFLPADMVSQILNFGAPAPIDVQISGPNMVENRKLAADLLARINHVPGIADARIQQAFQAPALNVAFNRMMAGMVGLTEHDAAASMQNSLAGSSQTTPIFWLNPQNGVNYAVSVQTPQYRIDTLDGLKTMPVTTTGRSGQLLGGLATMNSGTGERRRYALQYPPRDRHLRDDPRTRPWRGHGGHPEDPRRNACRMGERRKGGRARPSRDDGSGVSRALRRLGPRHRSHLPADRRQLSVVARSFHYHHGAADGFGGHRLDVVRHRHHLVGAGPHRRDHVHGRRDGKQHPGHQLCARTPRGRCGRRDRGDRVGWHKATTRVDDRTRDDHRHGSDGDRVGPECAARPRCDRRPRVRHVCDAVLRADFIQYLSPARRDQS